MSRSILRFFASVVAIGLGTIALDLTAVAGQQGNYAPVLGDLTVDADLTTNGPAELAGSGFLPSSPVQIEIVDNTSGDVTFSDTGTTSASGSIEYSFAGLSNLKAGGYTASISGMTPDGATLVLSGPIQVEPPDVPESEVDESEEPEPASPTTESPNDDVEVDETAAAGADAGDDNGLSPWLVAPIAAAGVAALGSITYFFRRSSAA